MKKVLDYIFDWTNRIVLWISTIALFFMTAIVFYQVVARYVFNKPPMWTEEIALITMIWISMLGAGVGVRTGIHVKVEIFISAFSSLVRKIIDTLILLSIAFFGIGMSYYTFILVKRLPNRMAATGIP
ncbi:MAG: TRAP transporter small permease, partial [Pseudothermotoga sp.]